MNCHCGFLNLASAAACGRCGSILRAVAIAVHPPRAGFWSQWKPSPRTGLQLRPPGDASLLRSLAGLVPGLGHWLEGCPLGAVAALLAQTVLLIQVIYFAGTTWGNIVAGLAVFNHIFSVLDLHRKKLLDLRPRERLKVTALVVLMTLTCVYSPIYGYLTQRYNLYTVGAVNVIPALQPGDVVVVDRSPAQPIGVGDIIYIDHGRAMAVVEQVAGDSYLIPALIRGRGFLRSIPKQGVGGKVVRIWQPLSRRRSLQ